MKSTLTKTTKFIKFSAAFLILFDVVFAINMLFLFPDLAPEWVFVALGLGVLTIFYWFRVLFSDPGFVQIPKGVDFLSLM